MASLDKEWVDTYFDRGVDVPNRRVFIREITEKNVDRVIKGLYLMETDSTRLPCDMFISSVGGELYDTLALYDIMQTIKCPIHTFAYGKCMSAAPLLLAAGVKGNRWVAEHVSFMYHDADDGLEGNISQLESGLKHVKELDKIWIGLLAEHSNKPESFWSRLAKKPADFYFSADQAIEWGIADSIWSEK